MVERVEHDGRLLALILRADFQPEGIEFYTDDDSAQQVGAMAWPKGRVILPHMHNLVDRTVSRTQEVLVIRKGKVRVDLFDESRNYLESRILNEGDIILLASGGHGFTMLEDAIMVEIKQGPYLGEQDKVRFEPIAEDDVSVKHSA